MDWHNDKKIGSVLGLISLFLILLVIWFGVDIINNFKEGKYIGRSAGIMNTISVSGTGKVFAKPDLALVNFSVVTEKATVAEAMSENTEKMNSVIEAMKNQGVEEKDLKTTSFYVSPRYEYRPIQGSEALINPSRTRVLVGYEITQSLEVKIRNMEKIGDVIKAATDRGANEVGNLQFTIDDLEDLKAQARKEAIDNARARAKEIASQLGVRLVRVSNFYESPGADTAMMYYGMGGGVESSKAPSIATGENKTEVTVSITYEIN